MSMSSSLLLGGKAGAWPTFGLVGVDGMRVVPNGTRLCNVSTVRSSFAVDSFHRRLPQKGCPNTEGS